MKTTTDPSRRSFLKKSAATAFGFQIVPSTVWGANERLYVGAIGINGKGASDIQGVTAAGAKVVALCDVHERGVRKRKNDKPGRKRRPSTIDKFPEANFYKDFRLMLEKEGKHIDAVTVSTPDHLHCHAAVWAMRMGKHVYCQKPLSHSIWEARLMTEVAKEKGVATQMGNQAHSGEPIRRAVELIRAGIIGKVSEVHCWTNRPIWPQGIKDVPKSEPIPNGMNWYLWLGPAKDRPYSSKYCPFTWRGWWDFGTGALGDMGCHIMDMPFWALQLKHPTSVEADATQNTELSAPLASEVVYEFPEGPNNHKLKFHWYDGAKELRRMPKPEVFEGTEVNPRSAQKFDLIMIGDKGKFLFNRSSTKWRVYPSDGSSSFEEPPKTIRRVPNEDVEWVEACKGGPTAASSFEYSGPFTETVLLGNLAIRLGKKIEWDGPDMRAINAPEANALIRREYRDGWAL